MTFEQKINEDLKEAMKSGDKIRLERCVVYVLQSLNSTKAAQTKSCLKKMPRRSY